VGTSFFNDAIKMHVPEIHAQVIGEHGFDPALVERAIADPATIDDVRADHDHAAAAPGAHGVPTIILESGYSIYGPVVVPAPACDDAVMLWDLLHSMARFPNLYELRHPKTHDDLVHIAHSFETYLTTRDWNTVENPAP